MAKAAQEVMLRSLARDLAGTGVTANLLIVKTIDKDHERDREPTAKNAQWTTPEEIAAAMVMLCGDAAATINGGRIVLVRPLNGAAKVQPSGAGPIAPNGEGAQHVDGSGAGKVGLPSLLRIERGRCGSLRQVRRGARRGPRRQPPRRRRELSRPHPGRKARSLRRRRLAAGMARLHHSLVARDGCSSSCASGGWACWSSAVGSRPSTTLAAHDP